jgi:hypothetical protein
LLNGLNVQKIVVYVSVLEHKLHYKNPQPFLKIFKGKGTIVEVPP